MNVIDQHLQRFPHARPQTLVQLKAKADKTKQLQDEIKAEKRRKRFSWVSWIWSKS
ncbi:hypothetical protein D9M72_303990 [compost metagenome]